MKVLFSSKPKALLTVMTIVYLSLTLAVPGSSETIKTRLGELRFESGYPKDETVQKLYDELDIQRAMQTARWS